jgi:hypothetical protein
MLSWHRAGIGNVNAEHCTCGECGDGNDNNCTESLTYAVRHVGLTIRIKVYIFVVSDFDYVFHGMNW